MKLTGFRPLASFEFEPSRFGEAIEERLHRHFVDDAHHRRRRCRLERPLEIGVGADHRTRGEGVGHDEDRAVGGREPGLVAGEIGKGSVVSAEGPQTSLGQAEGLPGSIPPGDGPGDPGLIDRGEPRGRRGEFEGLHHPWASNGKVGE